MSDFERRFHANPQQADYWNTEAGKKWVQYDDEMDTRLAPMTGALIRRASITGDEHVLDVGCGAGSSTEQIAHAVGATGAVLGLDISEPLLELARTRCAGLRQVSFENADAQVHPFSGKSFDLLLSRFGVMFFSDPVAAFANLLNGLRPGGKLHFVCWASADMNPWFSVPLEVAKRHLGSPEPTPPRAPGPLAFSEASYVEHILASAGFRDVAIDTVETTMASPEPAEEQARLYMKMGPAARLIGTKSPDPVTLEAVAADLVSELRNHQTNVGIALGATVHYVSASA